MMKRNPYRSRSLDALYRRFLILVFLALCFGIYSWLNPPDDLSDQERIQITYYCEDYEFTRYSWGGLLEEPNTPTMKGYQFDGWYRVVEGEEIKWDFSIDEVTENITLYARFSPITCTVFFDPNGGICTQSEMTVYPDQEYSFPTPTREGYYFVGWYRGKTRYEDVGIWWRKSESYYLKAQWTTYPPGMTVRLGTYEQDNDPETTEEAIEWIVLEYCEGKYYLLSKNVLDVGVYTEQNGSENIWTESKIRLWLNDTFYQNAFSDKEKQLICESYLADVDTTDFVFLPSYPELYAYTLSEYDSYGFGTPYAIANGYQLNSTNEDNTGSYTHGTWWGRGNGKYFIAFQGLSYTVEEAETIGSTVYGIRPAIWVSEEVFLDIVKN